MHLRQFIQVAGALTQNFIVFKTPTIEKHRQSNCCQDDWHQPQNTQTCHGKLMVFDDLFFNALFHTSSYGLLTIPVLPIPFLT